MSVVGDLDLVGLLSVVLESDARDIRVELWIYEVHRALSLPGAADPAPLLGLRAGGPDVAPDGLVAAAAAAVAANLVLVGSAAAAAAAVRHPAQQGGQSEKTQQRLARHFLGSHSFGFLPIRY